MGSFLTRGVRARRSQRSAALSFGHVKASRYSKSFRGSTTVLLIAVAPRSVTRKRSRNIEKWKIMGGSLALSVHPGRQARGVRPVHHHPPFLLELRPCGR